MSLLDIEDIYYPCEASIPTYRKDGVFKREDIIDNLLDLQVKIRKANWPQVVSTLEILSLHLNSASDEELLEISYDLLDSVSTVQVMLMSLRSNIARLAISLCCQYFYTWTLTGHAPSKCDADIRSLFSSLLLKTCSTHAQKTLHSACLEALKSISLSIHPRFIFPLITYQLQDQRESYKLCSPLCKILALLALRWGAEPWYDEPEAIFQMSNAVEFVLNLLDDRKVSVRNTAKTSMRVFMIVFRHKMNGVLATVLNKNSHLARTYEVYSDSLSALPTENDKHIIETELGVECPTLLNDFEEALAAPVQTTEKSENECAAIRSNMQKMHISNRVKTAQDRLTYKNKTTVERDSLVSRSPESSPQMNKSPKEYIIPMLNPENQNQSVISPQSTENEEWDDDPLAFLIPKPTGRRVF